tara:strand:+ start:7614 stop:7997 length:384 start_codon:yes stop_codon:yes gene_type:complete
MFPFFCYSQLTVSTKKIELFSWDESEDSWSESLADLEKFSFFEFNEDITFLEFTTNKTKTYYSLSNEEYSSEYDHYSYDAQSDNGYEYMLIIDLKNKDNPNIRLVGEFDEDIMLIRYEVKYWWTDEE